MNREFVLRHIPVMRQRTMSAAARPAQTLARSTKGRLTLLPRWFGMACSPARLDLYDLHLGKHKLDIRFWREGEETAFEVIKGDPKLVERCDIASRVERLKAASDPF